VRIILFNFLRLGLITGAAVWLLGGCGWHHSHKPKSYDRSISDEDKDPTYQDNPQRAGEEIRDVQ